MNLNELKPAIGSKKNKKRVGRGNGTGLGKTAGRGSNGQNSRSGGKVRLGFEGGQMPLVRRIPKKGFSNAKFKKEYVVVNLDNIENKFKDFDKVSISDFIKANIITKKDKIKVLGTGFLSSKKNIEANAFSSVAKIKIEEQSGKVFIVR